MFALINTWQLNLVFTLIFGIFFYQYYKLALKTVKTDGAATVILQLIAGISILIFTPLFSFVFPADIKTYLLLFLASIFYAVNDRLQTTARKHLEVSVFSVINQLSNVFIIIIGLTIFREQFVVTKILGAGLILLGNAYLFYKRGKFELNKYAIYAILANMAFAVAMSTDIGISKLFNLPIYISITLIVPALLIKLLEKIPLSTIKEEYINGNKKYFFATGITWGLTILFSLRSFRFGQVTTIVPLSSTSVLLNVIVAYFLLNERSNLPKKIFAALLVMAGIYFTVLN